MIKRYADEKWKRRIILWHIIWRGKTEKKTCSCSHTDARTNFFVSSSRLFYFFPHVHNKKWGQVWFTSHSRRERERERESTVTQESLYLRSCPLSSDATSSIWTWSHSWEMKKESGYIKRSMSAWSPVRAGLSAWGRACGSDSSYRRENEKELT